MDEKRPVLRMLLAVTQTKDQGKIEALFDELHLPICFQGRGKGTAPTEMMDIFGLSGTARLLTIAIVPKPMVRTVFRTMYETLSFRHRGGGIAVTVPITGVQSYLIQMLDESLPGAEDGMEGDGARMKETSDYSVVWTSVVSGFSDEVIDAAREAGARGGTVIKGRRRNTERVSQHFGLALQEEQDFVMVIVSREKKHEVMTAISRACGLRTDAHGVVLSLPVDETMGLA